MDSEEKGIGKDENEKVKLIEVQEKKQLVRCSIVQKQNLSIKIKRK